MTPRRQAGSVTYARQQRKSCALVVNGKHGRRCWVSRAGRTGQRWTGCILLGRRLGSGLGCCAPRPAGTSRRRRQVAGTGQGWSSTSTPLWWRRTRRSRARRRTSRAGSASIPCWCGWPTPTRRWPGCCGPETPARILPPTTSRSPIWHWRRSPTSHRYGSPILVSADGAGCSKAWLAHLRGLREDGAWTCRSRSGSP